MKQVLMLILLFSILVAQSALGAACCGGGFATPSIISSDDSAQLTTSFSRSEIVSDVNINGIWNDRRQDEISQTFKVDAAHIFYDRWQAGFSVPIMKRSRASQSSTGLGDVSALLGYEYLTDWDYHPYRPKGIGFLHLIMPTGKSAFESDNIYGLDTRGRGFWALGLGTLLTKTFGKYDSFINFEIHKAFSDSVNESRFTGKVKPGWGGDLAIGAGYNTTHFRLGGSLAWSYEDPIVLEGTTNDKGVLQRYATLGLNLSYLVNEEWATTLTYSDQTLMGSPTNTSLSRSIMLMLQRRWLR